MLAICLDQLRVEVWRRVHCVIVHGCNFDSHSVGVRSKRVIARRHRWLLHMTVCQTLAHALLHIRVPVVPLARRR